MRVNLFGTEHPGILSLISQGIRLIADKYFLEYTLTDVIKVTVVYFTQSMYILKER